MEALIDSTIKHLLEETVKGNTTYDGALKLTQAALNLSHTKEILSMIKKRD